MTPRGEVAFPPAPLLSSFAMGQATPEATPNVYGRYETLFRIAAGGMAEVYAARVRGEAGFQKLVALKRMLPHLTDDDRFVTMFMDEGRLAANISSPNVVSTLDLGRADDESLYLVMELVVGTTLSNLLRNAARNAQPLPIDVAVELLAQAAQGLHDAHDARTPFGAPLHIVHRDVSPQNILIGTDGRVRITDFGVARAILRRTKTSTGEFKGKLSYFSPEQCRDKDLDRRSDIFSLGVVAWETLTTRRLFHAENPLAVLERVTRMEIPLAHEVNPAVPPEVSAVVATALERDRERRYRTAAEFAQALRAASRQTAGIAERDRIAEFVGQCGGESLRRIEQQLKDSLRAAPGTPLPTLPIDDAKTEISSGIVFRDGDGDISPATPPASMIPSTGASFVGMPTELSGASSPTPERTPSKLPYIIAAVVAAAGLAAGAVIGVMAVMGDWRETPTTVRVMPSVEDVPGTDDGTGTAPPGSDDEARPEAQTTDDPAGEATPVEPAPDAPSRPERGSRATPHRPAPQRSHRPQPHRTAPSPRHASEPSAAPRPQPVARPPASPQPDAPTTAAAPPRNAPARNAPTSPTPPRTRGLVGVDDFDCDVSH